MYPRQILRTSVAQSPIGNPTIDISDVISHYETCEKRRISVFSQQSRRSTASIASVSSLVNTAATKSYKKLKTATASISRTFRNNNIMDLYRDVKKWTDTASPYDSTSFRIDNYDKQREGEIVAFMFHINLNMNMNYGYEVIYASASNVMIIKKLGTVQKCILPQMKIVGTVQVIA